MKINEYEKNMQFTYVLCYLKTNKKQTAHNLWENGITTFRNATFYKEWDKIKNLDPRNPEKLIPYIKDSIIEKTRIITCFENFMKGHLLMKEILVHKFLISINYKRNNKKTDRLT